MGLVFSFTGLSLLDLGKFCQKPTAQKPDSDTDADNVDDNGNL